ncbi:MAG: 50S ribosomal protein L31 [Deltaproteobacteria bacterium]|nr:50S ribosomal protein L31 [Deltaproteobacteria bacterium]MBI2501411.1 50S ribosomal protein L31 [Deltaproteobacteria bacterium]MBI4197125.1 50S ribosomal protein L31 [Deltaproteobacteria bacterium]
MKADIHPTVHQVKVSCVCGHTIETISTTKELTVAVCSHCHPFYTGKQKLLDTAGRVERFQKRYSKKKG